MSTSWLCYYTTITRCYHLGKLDERMEHSALFLMPACESTISRSKKYKKILKYEKNCVDMGQIAFKMICLKQL